MAQQRYQAVWAVIADGLSVVAAAGKGGCRDAQSDSTFGAAHGLLLAWVRLQDSREVAAPMQFRLVMIV